MALQQTLNSGFEVEGIGLHTGREVRCHVGPAPEGSGYLFERTDLPGAPLIPGHWSYVASGQYATTLENGEGRVSTVEHLLSALYGMGVDNAHIRMNAEEAPVCDGSSLRWVSEIERAGTETQQQPRRVHVMSEPLSVIEQDRAFRALPGLGLELDVTVEFEHPAIGEERLVLQPSPESYKRELAWARTFGFKKDLDSLRQMGLGQGGSLENVLVFDRTSVANPEGLRGEGEVVRHKVLDLLGDLALSGVRFEGQFQWRRPGHAFTHLVLRRLRPSQEQ